MQRFSRISFSLLLIMLMGSAYAGPPFLTDDTDIASYKQLQVYVYSNTDTNPDGSVFQAPALELDWGFAPNFEMSISGGGALSLPKDGPNAFGIGDTDFSLGYRFIQETANHPSVAFIPLITVPSGDKTRGLGNGDIITQLPLWLQKSFNNWTIDTGGGYNINPEPGMYNNAFCGFLLQNQINNKLSLGGELFYQGAQSSSQGTYTVLNVGGSYNLTPQFSILFSVGNSIAGQQNFISYLGLYWAIQT
jgi:hypothetical protein